MKRILIAALALSLCSPAVAMNGTPEADAAYKHNAEVEKVIPLAELNVVRNQYLAVKAARASAPADKAKATASHESKLVAAVNAATKARNVPDRAGFNKQAAAAKALHDQACSVLGC